ncbi:MAG: glycoside hydrolase family 127 protein [Planctomycetes bacterium]|nr:glycoside hydrolase family 127 protein [Planctomycetota bacterium]
MTEKTEMPSDMDKMVPIQMCRIPETGFEFRGIIHDYSHAFMENWLIGIAERNPAIFEMFADREKEPYRKLLPWSGEFAGKYLTSAVQILRLTNNPDLRDYLQDFIDKLVSLQASNGYLGPWPRDYQLTGRGPYVGGHIDKTPEIGYTWDAWNHYHIMLGLLLWHEDTQDAKALRAAEKIGDLLCETFSGQPGKLVGIGNPDKNLAPVHSMCLLYRATGKTAYLDLAREIAEEEFPLAGDYVRTALAGKEFYQTPFPRWESLHAVMGMAELYWVTGDEKYRKAFEHIWWSIVKLDRHNTGGFSSGEKAKGDPYHLAAIETCCTIAWSAMSVEMLKLTGNSIVADEMELTLWNATLGSLSRSGKWSTYNTPMEGKRVPNTTAISFQIRPGSEELNCCSVNAPRGLGMISDWAVMNEGDALVLNWYGPSTLRTHIQNTSVTLEQTTDYPRTGKIQMVITPDMPGEFPLKLRIPYWSEKTRVAVNGETIKDVKTGSYLTLKRKWNKGDTVEIELDMSLHYWVGENECRGKTSIYRGPVLLAYNQPYGGSQPVFSGKWGGSPAARHSRETGATVTYKFEGDGICWLGRKFDDAGKAVVHIDGKKVAVVDQYDHLRVKGFRWERRGLEPGSHEIQITVLGQKNEESKGNYVNIGKLVPTASGPHLDAAKLNMEIVRSDNDQSLVTLETRDINNQKVILYDFDSAGEQGLFYGTWFQIDHAPKCEFDRGNPLRSCRP